MSRLCSAFLGAMFLVVMWKSTEGLISYKGSREQMNRMKNFFIRMDRNKDERISIEDYDLIADDYCKVANIPKAKCERIHKETVPEMWNAFPFDKKKEGHPVTFKEFVSSMSERRNDEETKRELRDVMERLYDELDLDNNGELSPKEHRYFLEALGVSKNDAKNSFEAIDSNKNGVVERKEWLDGAYFYLTGDDKSCGSRKFWGPLD